MNMPTQPPVLYIPNFIPDAEALNLFDRLFSTIPWEQKSIVLYGKTQPVPRLTCWFGEGAYAYSGIVNRPRGWTDELLGLRRLAEESTSARYNSCLANLYRDGNDSVGWHADNEAELGPTPTIASLSLGTTRTFRLKHLASSATFEYELLAGSLLVMYGQCQADWRHSVPKRARLRGPRINLTFRHFDTSNIRSSH